MKWPRLRFSIRQIMIASAVVAVALVSLRSNAVVFRLPVTPPPPVTLPDGTIVLGLRTAEVNVTWFGVLLMAAVLGMIVLIAAWLARLVLRAARQKEGPKPLTREAWLLMPNPAKRQNQGKELSWQAFDPTGSVSPGRMLLRCATGTFRL